MAPPSARELAFTALSHWRRTDRFADAILQQLLSHAELSSSDRAFATELFYGILRNLTLLDFWIDQLRSGSIEHDSRDLLRLGLYQLFLLRTPGHAAVFETVELGGRRKRPLINGVLRAALRRSAELQAAAASEGLATRWSHPEFLVERWTQTYGAEAAAALCAWNNKPAPLYARVNLLRTTVEAFLGANSTAKQLDQLPRFVRLETIPTEALARGDCYVQDPSTATACELLDPQPGETVLDACAAPGGKTSYLADLMHNAGDVVACDRNPARLEILRANLHRLGATSGRVLLQDWIANESSGALTAGSFDRILVDAPCTNTGVMRRRVDLRWRLQPKDFARMRHEQLTILRSVVPFLKPGGVLVYSTCSIESEENEKVVAEVLRDLPFLRLSEQRSVLPFQDHYDGAFAAKLTRVT